MNNFALAREGNLSSLKHHQKSEELEILGLSFPLNWSGWFCLVQPHPLLPTAVHWRLIFSFEHTEQWIVSPNAGDLWRSHNGTDSLAPSVKLFPGTKVESNGTAWVHLSKLQFSWLLAMITIRGEVVLEGVHLDCQVFTLLPSEKKKTFVCLSDRSTYCVLEPMWVQVYQIFILRTTSVSLNQQTCTLNSKYEGTGKFDFILWIWAFSIQVAVINYNYNFKIKATWMVTLLDATWNPTK